MLTSQKLDQLIGRLQPRISNEIFKSFDALINIFGGKFEMIARGWRFALANVATQQGSKRQYLLVSNSSYQVWYQDDLIKLTGVAFASNLDNVLVLKDDEADLPKIISILEVDVLSFSWPLFRYH